MGIVCQITAGLEGPFDATGFLAAQLGDGFDGGGERLFSDPRAGVGSAGSGGFRRWVSRAVCAVLAARWIGLGFGGLLLHLSVMRRISFTSAGDS